MHISYLIAAAPCALIGLAGWRNHRLLRRREAAATTPAAAMVPVPVAAPAAPAFAPGQTPLAVEMLPARAALQDALRALDTEAARHLTQLTVAAAPGLTLCADPAALGQALCDIVGGAIRRSPHGRVLVCAAPHDGSVQIAVTDEGAGAGEDALAALSEATPGIVALHGGTLEARCRHGVITVVLRLPAPSREQVAAPARPGAASAGAPAYAAGSPARASEPAAA